MLNKRSMVRFNSVGDLIRFYRMQANLSQKELADKAGMNVNTVSFMETGRRTPSIDCLTEIAKALGLKLQIDFYPSAGIPLYLPMEEVK